MSAQVAADLRAAADVLERDGWTREAYVDMAGRCCAAGAILKVVAPDAGPETDLSSVSTQDYERMGEAARALADAIGLQVARFTFWDAPITRWNDDPDRTADEVIATLRTAADAAEADQ